MIGSTPLDDFLAGSDSAVEGAERLQRLGLLGSVLGLTAAVGLVAFLALVHSGHRREIVVLLRAVGVAAIVLVAGAAVEIAGVARLEGIGWTAAITDPAGAAAMMRLLAGSTLLFGLFEHTAFVDGQPADTDDPVLRWTPDPASAFAYTGLLVGAMSFWFDGHTVTEGPRLVHALVDVVHVGAAGVWFGGIVGLVVVGVLRHRSEVTTAALLIRFSTVATVALVLVALAGALMTLMIIDDWGDLTGTDWGRALLVKTGAVAIAVAIGGYHHWVVVPALERGADGRTRPGVTLAIEAVVLMFVVAVTVVVTTSSTV